LAQYIHYYYYIENMKEDERNAVHRANGRR